MSRPSVWSTVWRNFINSLRKNTTIRDKTYVGEDHFGNRYYEYKNPEYKSNVKRGVERVADASELPHEWEMWLKNTRKFPPSELEIQNTQIRQQRMQQLLKQQDAETELRAPKVGSAGRGAADIDRPTQYPVYEDETGELRKSDTHQKRPGERQPTSSKQSD